MSMLSQKYYNLRDILGQGRGQLGGRSVVFQKGYFLKYIIFPDTRVVPIRFLGL